MSETGESALQRHAVDELYGGPADDFVARRTALAAALVRDGHPDAAAELKRRRRPTVAADAVNRVARAHPDDVHALIAAGERLQQAQADAVAGRGGTDLRAALKSRNEIVERLTDLALATLAALAGSPQSESHRSVLASTFEAASVDPEARAPVEAGTLVKELAPMSRGLGGESSGSPVVSRGSARPSSTSRGTRATAPDPKAAARADAERARAAVADARRIDRDAQRRADRDEAAAMRARAQADEAARVVERIESELAGARRAERDARTAARVADRASRESASAAAKAAERVRSLEAPDE